MKDLTFTGVMEAFREDDVPETPRWCVRCILAGVVLMMPAVVWFGGSYVIDVMGVLTP